MRARKGGLSGRAVEAYVRQKVRGAFRGVWLRGSLPRAERGLLLYANHTNWWDGFVVHALSKAAGWDGYCLMEEKQLLRFPFLSRLGAFSVKPGAGSSSLQSLRYAKGLLEAPGAAVLLFPQGEIRPFSEALFLQGGVAVLARAAAAHCLSVGIRYAFFEHEKPDVLLEVGTPHRAAPLSVFREQLEERVTSLGAVRRLEGFQPLLAGRAGVAQRWHFWRGLGRGGQG